MLLALLALLSLSRPALAVEYHVTPLTFAKASMMALRPGDTLWLGSGTYAGGLEAYSLPGGTADFPITVKAEVSGLAVVDGGTRDCWSLAGCTYWTFEGLTFQNAEREGLYLGPSNHVVLRNCTMRFNGDSGLLTGHCTDLTIDSCEFYGSKAQHGAYLSRASSRFVIRNSSFYRNRRAGAQFNNQGVTEPFTTGLVEGCRFWSNGSTSSTGTDPSTAAINVLLVTDVKIRNCQITGNWANGVTLSGTRNCLVDACQITFAPGTGWRCVVSSNGSDATNTVSNSLLVMGQNKPPTDGVLTQVNDTQATMPKPVDAGGTATPVP